MSRDPRAIVLVLDSVGVGALPDADQYGDEGSNTLGNTSRAVGGLSMPNLEAMGLGNITDIEGVPRSPTPDGFVGPQRRGLCGQGHDDRSLGDDGAPAHGSVSDLSRRIPSRGHGRVRAPHRPRLARQLRGQRDRDHPGPRRRARGHRQARSSTRARTRCSRSPRTKTSSPSRSSTRCARPRARCSSASTLSGASSPGRSWARTTSGPMSARIAAATSPSSRSSPRFSTGSLEVGVTSYGVGKIGEIFGWQGICESPHVTDNMDGFDKLVERVGLGRAGVRLREPGRFRHALGPSQRRRGLRPRSRGCRRAHARAPGRHDRRRSASSSRPITGATRRPSPPITAASTRR